MNNILIKLRNYINSYITQIMNILVIISLIISKIVVTDIIHVPEYNSPLLNYIASAGQLMLIGVILWVVCLLLIVLIAVLIETWYDL